MVITLVCLQTMAHKEVTTKEEIMVAIQEKVWEMMKMINIINLRTISITS